MNNSYLSIYNNKYLLWIQLAGCIGIFGSFFVVIIEGIENGLPIISISMFIIGIVLCTFNRIVELRK